MTGMHLIVLGDSLTQPRSWVGLGVKDTYAFRLQAEFAPRLAATNLGVPQNDTSKQLSDFWAKRTYIQAEADFVVIQLGIVDCAPRLYFEGERLVLAALTRIPVIKWPFQLYMRLRSRYRMSFTRYVRLVTVPKPQFARNLAALVDDVCKHNPVRRVYLVNIAYPGRHMLSRSFDVIGNIRAYNEEIAALAAERGDLMQMVDVFSYTESNPAGITADDGHHLTAPSHRFIADTIAADLRPRLSSVP